MFRGIVVITLVLCPVCIVQANELTGTVHTLHINLESSRAFVYLDGKPTFDGGGCTSFWTANSLGDQNFMNYVWPLLMMAKAGEKQVSIDVEGCNGIYPKIRAVDVPPRD